MTFESEAYKGYEIRTYECGTVDIIDVDDFTLVDGNFFDVGHAKVYIDGLFTPPQTINNSGVAGYVGYNGHPI